jgi:hypothetical protein
MLMSPDSRQLKAIPLPALYKMLQNVTKCDSFEGMILRKIFKLLDILFSEGAKTCSF